MVTGGYDEARRQRILKKRELAKKENEEVERKIEKVKSVKKQESTSDDDSSAEDTKPEVKKPKLEKPEETTSSIVDNADGGKKDDIEKLPDSTVIVANVFRFLEQEYKYMKICNMDHASLRPLAAIQRRTSAATGLTREAIRSIVNADKEGRLRRRNNERVKEDSD